MVHKRYKHPNTIEEISSNSESIPNQMPQKRHRTVTYLSCAILIALIRGTTMEHDSRTSMTPLKVVTPLKVALAGALLAWGVAIGFAQTQPPATGAPAETPPPNAAAPQETPLPQAPATDQRRTRTLSGKRGECREATRKKGLRGEAAKNNVMLCIQEARTECFRQAIAQKIPRQTQRDFVKKCLD